MKKEIKKEEKKSSKIYLVILAIAIIAGAIVFFKPKADMNGVGETQQVVNEVAESREQLTTARIDITTKLVDVAKPQFEVYVDESETPLEHADWMTKFNIQGSMVQKDGESVDIFIKALEDADINLVLRGKWEQDKDNNMVENWVKYTSLTINGKEILPEAVAVWHNKPYRYIINAKAGEEYKIHAEWTEADAVPEE